MKIRDGFVSNSSSASFIIGVAKVIDEELVVNYCKKHGIRYEIKTTKELLDENQKTFRISSFDDSEVSIDMDPNKNEKFISIQHYEEMEESEDGETNYDIDFETQFGDFGNKFISLEGIEKLEYIYGAGRNG